MREHLSMFAGGYALIALFLFARAKHFDGWELFKPFFIISMIFGVCFFGALWVAITCREIHNPGGGGGLLVPTYGHSLGSLRTIIGICSALFMIGWSHGLDRRSALPPILFVFYFVL